MTLCRSNRTLHLAPPSHGVGGSVYVVVVDPFVVGVVDDVDVLVADVVVAADV